MRKFVRIVRKSIKDYEKDNPPSLDSEEIYTPPKKDIKIAFSRRKKYWFREYKNAEINDVCRDVLDFKYCCENENGNLKLKQAGKSLTGYLGFVEEMIRHRKRSITVIVALAVVFIGLSAFTIGVIAGLAKVGYDIILRFM